ncbi:MAG TPA: histidinol-phosphate transaminase [Acidimicrobiales bacterium]|nr:histidinol-phosphate transaminase [Acidimicrobiales bacterium]
MTLPVRAGLDGLADYHSPQVSVEVRLNTNESPYPPPAGWREAFLQELQTVSFHRYPDRGAAALRGAIAELHGVPPAQIFAANGSNEVIQALCLAYGGPTRTAVVFEPTYALHAHIARLTGTEVVTGARDANFVLDPAEAERTISAARPAVTFLCSPNNPTGMVDAPDVLDAARAATDAGLVIVDEAYGQFASQSAIDDVADDGNLVVTRTFSKTWSMAALRLGYCVAPAEVVAALDRVILPYHLDVVQQIAGRLALRYKPEMEARVAMLVDERGRLVRALSDLAVDVWPSGANFVLFRPRAGSGTDIWEALVARSVLVRNCSTWAALDGCLRVTVGTPAEDDAFLEALAEVLG